MAAKRRSIDFFRILLGLGARLLDHAVMIDQGLGYPAIKRRLRQVAQADFSRTPFPAGVVRGAVKFGCETKFWSFTHSQTFTWFPVRCRPRYLSMFPIRTQETPVIGGVEIGWVFWNGW